MSNSEFQLVKLSHHSCKICAYELLLNLKKNVQIGNCLRNPVLGENWSNNRLAPHLGLLPVWEILDPPLVHFHKNFLSWQKTIKHQSKKYSKILVLTIYLQPRALIHPAGRALTSDWYFWLDFNWFDSERFSARQIVASNWFWFHWFSCLIHSSSFVMVVYENFLKLIQNFLSKGGLKFILIDNYFRTSQNWVLFLYGPVFDIFDIHSNTALMCIWSIFDIFDML